MERSKKSGAPPRIAVWAINYAPEVTGIAPYNQALCEFLLEKGNAVEMVTSFSYYPSWKKRSEDEGLLCRTDRINEVPVHRCWHYVPGKVTAWKRIIHEASFVFTSTIRMLTLRRFDLLIVVSPPLLLGAAAWLISIFKKSPFIFHVQDLQPDAALGLGMVREGMFIKLLYRLERFSYLKASMVSGISAGMVEAFRRKGVPISRIKYFPNGISIPAVSERPARGHFRAAHGFQPNQFLVVYSGNLGIKQDLETVINAAGLLKNIRIRILISGDGADRPRLVKLAEQNGSRNVVFLPLSREAEYRKMLMDADVCLIPQLKGSGAFFFPSKLLSVLSLGRPVLSVADDKSELARVGLEHGFGINVPPGEPQTLARTLEGLALDPEPLDKMGRAGFAFVQRFEMRKVLAEFEKALQSMLNETASTEMHCDSRR